MNLLCITSACLYEQEMKQITSSMQAKFEENEIHITILDLSHMEIEGCHACGKCQKRRSCILDDIVNPTISTIRQYDGILVGYDLQYGYPNNQVLNFLERLIHCASDQLSYLPVAYFIVGKQCNKESHRKIAALLEMMNATVLCNYRMNPVSIEEEEKIDLFVTRFSWILKCIQLGKENEILKPENHEILRDFMR